MLDIFDRAGWDDEPIAGPSRGYSRLQTAINWSYSKQLLPFRQVRKSLIDVYTGGSYGDGGESGSVLVNLLELAVSIYQRQLASHTPAVMVDTSVSSLLPIAKELQLAVNHVIDIQLDLGKVLNEWVIDAIFGLGILKVGKVRPSEPSPRGFRSRDLPVFAECIGLEDWVHDMSARKWEDVDYAGHLYEVDIEEVMDNPAFDKRAKELFYSSVRARTSQMMEYGDPDSRPETLSGQGGMSSESYIDKGLLWELWLPRDGVVLTCVADHEDQPLLEEDWTGPDRGPYNLLGFSPVPGNIMPIAPASLWEDMMDIFNRLLLKAGDQADRQRTILAGMNRASNAMKQIMQAADGETALTDVDPNQIKEFRLGGVDGGLMATIMQFKDLFNYQAGNIDQLGGLGSSTQTIGQDKMLKASASERLADYQERTVKATSFVVKDIANYLWEDDEIELPLTKPLTSTISRDFKWNAESKRGEFFDYNFKVTPYSLQAKSPQDRLMAMSTVVNQTILPMLEMMQQQGLQFDIFKYLEHVAELSNVSEINDLIKNAEGKTLNSRDSTDPAKSPITSRNYTRQSVPGSNTQEGQQNERMQEFQQMAKQQQSNQGMMQGQGRPPAASMR